MHPDKCIATRQIVVGVCRPGAFSGACGCLLGLVQAWGGPSSLGTILSFGMMGMARTLRGKTEADVVTAAQALQAGVEAIMDKAESKPGEKTILDALTPGATALVEGAGAVAGADGLRREAIVGS